MLISPHTHCESFLTSSTLPNLIERAKALGRTYFTCTDLGYLHSSYKAYSLAKKSSLKPILGLEFYFKDLQDPIITGTKADRCKYFTATAYATDQESYQQLCRLVSRQDFQTIEIREEKQNLFTWSTLEELSRYNIQIVLGGIHCLVGKSYLASSADIGLKVFEKLNSLFPGKLSVAIIAEPWQKKYSQVIEVKYTDGTRDSLLASDTLSTDRSRKIKAQDLIDRPGHTEVVSKVVGGIYTEVGKDIDSIKLHKGFLPLSCDVTLKMNKFLVLLAKRYNTPILVSDYAYYANQDDRAVQDIVLEGKDRIHSYLHMKSQEEILNYLEKNMGLSLSEANKIVGNNTQWAKLFDNFELKYEWRLASTEGENPLKKAMEIIKRNGRMRWDDKIYVDRLRTELEVIAKNGIKDLTPYFLPIVEVLDYYTEQGHLTSPGRGSAGGSLFCYLLAITNIDPIRYDLPFNRFFSKTRIEMRKLPDIDTDLPQKITLTGEDGKSGFLYQRWGNKAGHVSTRQTIRLRSAIKDVSRYFNGSVSREVERFVAGLPNAPQGTSDGQFVFGYENEEGEHIPGLLDTNEDLQKYAKDHPKDWAIIEKAMGLTRAFSKHACAYVLSDVSLDQTIPIKEGYITHYEHKQVEQAGLVKMDFLTISQLLDIEICLDLINERNGDKFEPGYFRHNGVKTYIWDLPDESAVYKSIWSGSTETLFQINSAGMAALVQEMLPDSLETVAAVLALERPGPRDYKDPNTGLNMIEEYLLRRKGESEPDIKELAEILPESYGVMYFQEHLGKIAKQLAGFTDEEAEILRENMAKKYMVELTKIKPAFINGAKKKVPLETAEKIWDQMVTFGRYGFSIIHSYEYAKITYACMFLRQNYNLAWWSAVLTNAEEKEITSTFWKFAKELIAPPDINLSSEKMVPDYANNKIRAKMGVVRGMGDKTIDPIVAGRPYKDIQDFVNKDVAGQSLSHKLIHVGMFDSLFKPGMSLEEKLKAYEDAVEIKRYQDKKAAASQEGKKVRLTQPKEGVVPEKYVNLHPMIDIAMKKSVLPTMPVDLYSLGAKYSKVLDKWSSKPKVVDPKFNKSVFLIDGNAMERLDKLDSKQIDNDIYVAATGYVIEAKEQEYQKGTKRMLKMVVACDNYISEKILWPDWDTSILTYPKELKKGSIVTLFFRKKAQNTYGKNDELSVINLIVEA